MISLTSLHILQRLRNPHGAEAKRTTSASPMKSKRAKVLAKPLQSQQANSEASAVLEGPRVNLSLPDSLGEFGGLSQPNMSSSSRSQMYGIALPARSCSRQNRWSSGMRVANALEHCLRLKVVGVGREEITRSSSSRGRPSR